MWQRWGAPDKMSAVATPPTWDQIGNAASAVAASYSDGALTQVITSPQENGSGPIGEIVINDQQPPPSDMHEEREANFGDLDQDPKPQKSKFHIGPYARFPNRLFGSGRAREIGTSAVTLYICLCEFANRFGSNTFRARDRVLADETGLAERTIRNARNKLVEKELVSRFRPSQGQQFEYTILPQDLEWVPVAERPRKKKKPRAMTAASSIRGP